MIGSMFNLDHRMTELRPSDRDHEVARQLRDAASSANRSPRATASTVVVWRNAIRAAGQPARSAAG